MNLYLPTLSYGPHEPHHAFAMERLTWALHERGLSFVRAEPVAQESLVTRGRNRVAHAFLASLCTHLLFVDCDIVFAPSDALRLIDSGLDFVGAPYPAKCQPPRLIGNVLQTPTEDPTRARINRFGDGFVEAQDVGTGFVLIARSVFDLLAPHVTKYKNDLIGGAGETMGAYFDCGPEDSSRDDSQYLSEDWWFSRLYRAAGGHCWLDTRAKLGHIGKWMFTAPSLEEQWAKDEAA